MRESGRTTRIIDQAIQELFIKGEVKLVDHHQIESRYLEGTKFAFDTLLGRLQMEHQHNKFKIDKSRFIVKLIK